MKVFAALDDAAIVKTFFDKTAGLRLNYLVSYYYLDGQAYKLTQEYRHMINKLYLDSGAYTVATGRSRISISEYAKYLALYGNKFTQFFNLDDDFENPDHNLENQGYLEDNLPSGSKRPIPVVHDNDDPYSEFRQYVDLGHGFIALGSTTDIPNETIEKIKTDFTGVRIHLFGKTGFEKLKSVMPYSADSTTWADAAGFGDILYLDPDDHQFHKIYMGSKDRRDGESDHYMRFEKKDKVADFLRSTFGYEYSDLLVRSGATARRIVNLYYYKQLEDYLTSLESSG
jgi:hypothetical protein